MDDEVELNKQSSYIICSVNKPIVKILVQKKLITECSKGDTILFKNLQSKDLIRTEQLNTFLKSYWGKYGILYHIYKPIVIVKKNSNNFNHTNILDEFKSKLKNHLDLNYNSQASGIAYALICGNKSFISKDDKNSLKASGIYHILAVSGLHIGLIFISIQQLIKFFLSINPFSTVNLCLSLSVVWGFTVIAEMSPSSVRAALIITFISIGRSVIKEAFLHKNIIRLFWITLIINLCFNPYDIYSLGFQFSYLAYFGIIIFYEPIRKLLACKYHTVNKISSLMSLSISAQLMVLPMSILHFKTIPSLFVISNILTTPILPLIYTSFISTLCPHFMKAPFLKISEWLIIFPIKISDLINKIPYSQIIWENFNHSTCILAYTLIGITACYLYNGKKYIPLLVSLGLILSILIPIPLKLSEHQNRKVSYIQSKAGPYIIENNNNNVLIHSFHCNSIELDNIINYGAYPNSVIYNHCMASISNIKIDSGYLLIINGLALKKLNQIKNRHNVQQIVLLNSPFIDFRVIENLNKVHTIYFDKSSKAQYKAYWKKACLKRKINFFELRNFFQFTISKS